MPNPVLLLIPVLVGGALLGVYAYLVKDHRRHKAEAEREQAERIAAFPQALLLGLKATPVAEFSLSQLAHESQVPYDSAKEAARSFYLTLCRKVVADGVITQAERDRLDRLAVALELVGEEARDLEHRASIGQLTDLVATALDDGHISGEELDAVQKLKAQLGLTKLSLDGAGAGEVLNIYTNEVRKTLFSDRPLVRSDLERLQHLKSLFGVGGQSLRDAARDRLLGLYRELAVSIVADGIVSEDEESKLAWLEQESGIAIEDLRERVLRTKELGRNRAGRLSSQPTAAMLNGGEICHWEGRCRFRYLTRAEKLNEVDGVLLVTSNRIVMRSSTKGFEYSPSKIVNIQVLPQLSAVHLALSKTSGTGAYIVSDPELLESVLVGLVRRHKFSLAEQFDSERTRHIAGEVKREVWARDGGRCVQCGASDYLEYDHIIPHSRGGANTVANIQVLCRRCNLQKRDRI